ncbi:MAG: aspartate kinase [Planctomycetia bacterium]|nr:aspartate kinase [Planctomycetia bacterium]
MGITVMKFGGTSVETAERVRAAAQRAIDAKLDGNNVVVVVSARGKTTDELLRLAREITDDPSERELDQLLATGEQISIALLAMAIHAAGHEAISFTGAQIGLVTDSSHTRARIKRVNAERMLREFEVGNIVIVAGFQGVNERMDITTLGRGGSDTTAAALAAALDADVCEIYTDVDGIYTADPRIVPDARKIDNICYDEMLELASLGAGVMHSRAIEYGKKYHIPICVRSSFSDSAGTLITEEVQGMEDITVRGAALKKDLAKVTLSSVPDRPGIAAHVFHTIASQGIVVDDIIQNVGEAGLAAISFTVGRDELARTIKAVESLSKEIGAGDVVADDEVSKVSVVGVGMRSHTGVAEKMFQALADAKINIQMITTSEIKISCIISRSSAEEALRTVHKAFDLGEQQ